MSASSAPLTGLRDEHGADGSSGRRSRRPAAVIATAFAALVAMLIVAVPALALPAGRGYEKVSPGPKDGQDILNGLDKAAANGDAASYISFGAFADSEGGGLVTSFLSDRSSGDWLTTSIGPAQVTAPSLATSLYQDFSDDVQTSIVGYLNGDPGFDGATPGTSNIYRRNPDGTFDLLSRGQPPVPPGGFGSAPNTGGSSADLGINSFTFASTPALVVTDGPTGIDGVENAYSSNGDDLRLVSVLPNGNPAPEGGFIGQSSFAPGYNTVSDDGSRIAWTSGGFTNPSDVYVRIDGTDTVRVSESQRTPVDPDGPQPKTYNYSTPNGDFVFFSSGEKLTDDATAAPGLSDLYRYEMATGELVDLTTQDADGAGLQGVIGVSDDGQSVYFAATGALAPGAVDGELNLYASIGGTTRFITGLDFADTENWGTAGASKLGRVNAAGTHLMFGSRRQQLGYDNAGFMQFYVYDAAADEFACISCRPDGEPATGDAAIAQPQTGGLSLTGLTVYERRNLSTDGNAFFSSPEALVPADTNGRYDAYMWTDGTVEIVSSGQSSSISAFVDASRSGDNAFFITREQLVGVDNDDQIDMYDARVGGGLASQNPPPPAPPCEGDTCKPPATPPGGDGTPGSGLVDGPSGQAANCAAIQGKLLDTQEKAKQLHKDADKASGKKRKKLEKKAKKQDKKAKKLQKQLDKCAGQG